MNSNNPKNPKNPTNHKKNLNTTDDINDVNSNSNNSNNTTNTNDIDKNKTQTKSNPDIKSGRAQDTGRVNCRIHTDHFALGIEQRTAGISRVN